MIFQISQVQIGQRIVELRKKKQLSQEDLAKIVGISRPSVTQIELGKRSLNIMELQKLAKQLSKKGNSIRSNNTDDTNGIQMTADDLTDTISGIINKELNRR